MSFVENTAFQPVIWNNRNDDTQTITGRYYVGSAMADCSAGWLCNRGAVDKNGVYKMTAAADGSQKLYVCYPTDVPRVQDNHGNLYAMGSRTLGLGLPAGQIGPFPGLDEGQTVSFAEGNLTTSLGSQKYFTVSNGALAPATAAPSSGYYFELVSGLCADAFTEGNIATMDRITVKLCKA